MPYYNLSTNSYVNNDTYTNQNFVGLKNIDNQHMFVLPKNFILPDNIEEQQVVIQNFKKEFEKFVHTYMSKTKKDHNPIKIKKPNENGGFDEIVLHSSKFEAWHRLYNTLKKSIKNKKSPIQKYNDVFNSKSIERTILRGTFLLSSNNSPIFNQGLLNPDDAYRVHHKDDLYKLGSFILSLYKEKLGIDSRVLNIFEKLSKDCKNSLGFAKELDLTSTSIQKRITSELENIINKIQPLTEEINELYKAIKNLINGRDVSVGIDNFHHAWEELVAEALENTYSDAQVFKESDLGYYFTENNIDKCYSDCLYPDLVIIKDNILHILDPKYKLIDSEKWEDWFKQILYVYNFLNPTINQEKIRVNTNLYHIYPGDDSELEFSDASEDVQDIRDKYSEFKYIKARLDFITLLKLYNGSNDINNNPFEEIFNNENEDFRFLLESPKNVYKFSLAIPKMCTYEHNNGMDSEGRLFSRLTRIDNEQLAVCNLNDHEDYGKKYNKLRTYFTSDEHREELTSKYFHTKRLVRQTNGSFEFENSERGNNE